jgi:hypothetical protein
VREPALSSIELMLATDYHPFSGDGWIFELKYDGYRVIASKEQLLTRQKKDATTWYPETRLVASRPSWIGGSSPTAGIRRPLFAPPSSRASHEQHCHQRDDGEIPDADVSITI